MGYVIVAAGALIVDEAGRVLLVRRGHEPSKGLWSLPGGKSEPGETPAQTAAREVREETGFVVDVGDELWCLELPAGNDISYEIHDFSARVASGDLRSGDDAAEVGWFAPEDLPGLAVTDGLLDYLARAGIAPS